MNGWIIDLENFVLLQQSSTACHTHDEVVISKTSSCTLYRARHYILTEWLVASFTRPKLGWSSTIH